jgi:hypothetical protein
MQLTNEGLTLWYDTPDAPVTDSSVTVGARPAHPANVVVVQCRNEGGFISSLRASEIPSGSARADQYFRVPLPSPASSKLEILPVLMCSGRQSPAPVEVGPTSGLWFPCPMASRPAAKPTTPLAAAGPRFSYELDFLGSVSALLINPPESVGLTPQGIRRNFFLGGGSCVGPRLNARVRPSGGDWLLIQRDGVALPSVRTTWETADGAVLYADYSGVFDLGENGYEQALQDRYPEKAAVQLTPRFATADPRYAWINRLQCLGVGNVDLVTLKVAYDLYAVRGGLAVLPAEAR